MASDAVVLTDIRNMIDLAIGTPEVGVVDFCMLHTVLHCLAQQMHVLDKPVELRGSAATMPTAAPSVRDNGQTIAIMEYIVETDAASPVKPTALKPEPTSAEPPTLLVVERVRKDASPDRSSGMKGPDRSTGTSKSQSTSDGGARKGRDGAHGGQRSGGERDGVHRDGGQSDGGQRDGGQRDGGQGGEETRLEEQTGDEREYRETGGRAAEPRMASSAERLSLVTMSKFNMLEDVVQDLKDRVYGSIPKNEQILEDVRSQTNLKAITDMWTNLNVSSRLEAAEMGLGKLSSLIEDLIREGGQRPGAFGGHAPPGQAPYGQAPVGNTPAGQAPAGYAPAGQAPGGYAPAGQAPGGYAPDGQAPGGYAPAGQVPAGQVPAGQAPGGQAPAGYAHAGQAPGGHAAGGQEPAGYAPAGQAPGGQGPAGYAPAGQAPVGQAPAGYAPAGQAPGGQEPAGYTPDGQAPGGHGPAGYAPAGQAPAGQAPGGYAPAGQAPGGYAPAGQAPGGYAPVGQAPGGYAPAGQAPDGYAASCQAPYAAATQFQVPPYVYEAANFVASLGPPYPWDRLASELYEERVSVLSQLERLRSDLDNLSKAFYDVMKGMQDGLDPKQAAAKAVIAAEAAPPAPRLPPPPPLPLPPVPTAAAAVSPQGYAQPPGAQAQGPGSGQAQGPVSGQAQGTGQGQAQGTGHGQSHHTPMSPAEERRAGRRGSGTNAGMMDRLAQLEKRIRECCDSLGKDKGTVQDQLNNFQDQLNKLMRQVGTLHDEFSALKISPNLAKDLEGLMQLYKTVQDMQEQLRQVNETAKLLAGEKDDRQHHMNSLLEQIEILKTIKMDREDMAEAMAEKADLRLLARKVSHDQFEMACDDLSRGLEHALGKLNTQESLWQQVLDDIQREIETKLDKMELSPLKEFFNNKLRQLQDNLKQMASLRRDVEAAGTSRRLLRDVNCISCDAKAVMPMENTGQATSKPLPAHLSMKPYLSYELDSIRKTQASNLPQRNLHDWETIDKQMAPKPPVRVRSETDKHICNRYCGGSHTTTTPAQRVARLGHFIKQWGPDVVPLSSGLAAGDDGRLYKVSTAEHASVGPGGPVEPTCTKKPKAPEPSKPPPRPLIPTPECRCLEDGN